MVARFTLRSTELREPWTRTCEFLRHVDEGAGPDKILVRVDPPVPGYLYGSTADLDRFVLAPRHKGASLYPDVSEWPCHVHVCLPKEGGTWDRGPYRIADWGLIERSSETEGQQ
jgi:hypothetical protein